MNLNLKLTGGIGDELAATAAVREWKRYNPDGIITVEGLTYQALFLNNPHIGTGQIDDQQEIRLFIHMHENLGNIARSFGIQLGIHMVDDTPEIFLLPRERERAARLIPETGKPVVALDVWARWPSRRWGFERYQEMADRLRQDFTVIEVGKRLPDHFNETESRLIEGVDLNLVDKLGVRELAALLEQCAVYVGSDSGGVHLAAAVGTPQVCLYSIKPWHSRSYWNTVACFDTRPCAPKCWASCHASEFCLDRIPVDHVEAAIKLAVRRFRGSQFPVAEPVTP